MTHKRVIMEVPHFYSELVMVEGYVGKFLTEDYIATRFNAPRGSVICEFLLEQLNDFVSLRKLNPTV